MSLLRALPRKVTRTLSILTLLAWAATMAVLVNRDFLQASSTNLATDLARYGSTAQWRGVYYRGEKIGFTVSQSVAVDDGFELQEDGRLQMALLGATTAARIRTTARVDRAFALRSFEFSLDPGTGPIEVRGTVDGLVLQLDIETAAGTRHERRELTEPPIVGLTLARRLAAEGLTPGARHEWHVFDPATLSNAPMTLSVGERETIATERRRVIPAFRVEMEFSGLRTTSWVTDTGEVVREESPLGLITTLETAEAAQAMAVGTRNRTDMIETAAVKPVMSQRIDEPRNVRRLRMRIDGVVLSGPDVQGAGQTVNGNIIELRDTQGLRATAADRDVARYLRSEPFIESDAPEIIAEARLAVAGAKDARAKAEQLTRYVSALLEKKPTVSLPSAREVLRTKVGDCNEHTALFVAMARAAGIPARIAVGLTFVRGAFYYHAWPEVYIDEGRGRGLWLPVDPTLNQFPADATHLRFARGGLDKQAAILPLIGQIELTVLDLELAPGSVPVIVGRAPTDVTPLSFAFPTRTGGDCWSMRR